MKWFRGILVLSDAIPGCPSLCSLDGGRQAGASLIQPQVNLVTHVKGGLGSLVSLGRWSSAQIPQTPPTRGTVSWDILVAIHSRFCFGITCIATCILNMRADYLAAD